MVTFGYCTKEHNEEYMSYLKNYFNGEVEVIEKICNKENGLFISEALNEIIKESKNDVIILVHDNIKFIWEERYLMRPDKSIEEIFERNPEYGILGVAPSCHFDRTIIERDYAPRCNLYSECESDGTNHYIYSSEDGTVKPFSLEIFDDVAVDGCLIALRRDRLKAGFCNENKSFHFYDIEFCIGNYLQGVKVGITKAFLIQHYKSQSEQKCWADWEKVKNDYFVPKWKDKLPIVKHKEQINLLMITACIRRENLPIIAESIHENLIKQNNVNLMWLISLDVNGENNLSDFEKICEKYRINHYVETHGTLQEKSYGGDMFNEMLKWAKYDYYGSNVDPWVYILDDDNLICPLMGAQLKKMIDTATNMDKPAIWMSMHREDGFIDTIRRYSIYGKGALNNITFADEFMPDPSQLLMRLSLIDDFGYFSGGFAYDQSLWNYFYQNIDKLCLPEDWHEGHWSGRGSNNFYQCYHNGINSKEAFDTVNNAIKNNEAVSFSLIAGLNESCERFLINKQNALSIIEKIKPDKKHYKYSILTCIFNGYESLKDIKDYREDVEYVCVTDNPNLTSDKWKIVIAPDIILNAPDTNRYTYIRFHPFEFVTTEVCIIMDASMEIKKDLFEALVLPFNNGNYQYGVTLHHVRSNMYEEIDAWKLMRGYDEIETERIKNVFKNYKYNIEGMVQSGFMIQRLGEVSNKINNLSWELAHNLSLSSEIYRNFQVALAFVLNKYYYNRQDIMLIHPNAIESEYIRHWTHNGRYWIQYDSDKTCPCVFWNHKINPFILN